MDFFLSPPIETKQQQTKQNPAKNSDKHIDLKGRPDK